MTRSTKPAEPHEAVAPAPADEPVLRACRVAPRIPKPFAATFPGINSIRPEPGAETRKLKVCIATEDIVGPIRNGGIGTTYTHLAYMLAEDGHEVTIVYLRGGHCENMTFQYWVDHYREKGVTFVPLEPAWDIHAPSVRWLAPMLALYRYLKEHSFDLVHVSEWRGSAALALLAKRQGLAFRDTLFCVKASSPYLWNRTYGLRNIGYQPELQKMFGERLSIERADMVIGGSAYLLRWMLDHGYRLPRDRCFVQPNVMLPVALDQSIDDRRAFGGQRVPVTEIVFFGRLEYRKGLHVFCEAMGQLIKQGSRPDRVTFLGKYGERIPMKQQLRIPEFIRHYAQEWPVEWQVIENYGQQAALTYLLGEGRVAVMPSIIENSSLAVYETTQYRIPFIATDVGGNAELVREDHRDEVLVEPHPAALARKLEDVLQRGAFIAEPGFDNAENLQVWRDFHDTAGAVIDEASGSIREEARAPAERPSIELVLVLEDHAERHRQTLDALLDQDIPGLSANVLQVGLGGGEAEQWFDGLHAAFAARGWRLSKKGPVDRAEACNSAAARSTADYLLFIDEDCRIDPRGLATLLTAATNSDADVLVPFVRTDAPARAAAANGESPGARAGRRPVVALVGDPAVQLYESGWLGQMLLVRRSAFSSVGGFTTDYKVAGASEEFLAAATLAGLTVETVPEVVAERFPQPAGEDGLNHEGAAMRAVRPFVRAAPLCYEIPLLFARSNSDRLNKRIRKMERSPSWQITQPLRIGKPFRKRFERIRNRFRPPG